ncbi:MAG TPA: putative sugar nucleotidyl transferase, partial [Puia sp.]|nr:putative sugar nucleotidyl transferase [Puia sp.]
MNEIVLDDGLTQQDLFPFTFTRSAAEIRIGILTIREKWEQLYHYRIVDEPSIHKIPSNLIPNRKLADELKTNQLLLQKYQDRFIHHPWQIFQRNAEFIKEDFALVTHGRKSGNISTTNRITRPENIFLEPGSKVEHASLNATDGPIY